MSTSHEPRVLVVDDEQDICSNLSDILTDLGYRVDCANDGPSALALVRAQIYDVALLDLKMPGMDGLTLYREIKRLRAATVALIVTAYASRAVAEEALAAGAWRVVSKPVNFPKLLHLVDEALEQPLVLVVDDDMALCANLWDLLRERGYRVCLAHDVSDAAAQLGAENYAVVLIDLKLPSGGGDEVFRAVRKINPQAKTIVITGNRPAVDPTIEKLMDEGVDAICYKPFDVPRLLEQLDSLVVSQKLDSGSGGVEST